MSKCSETCEVYSRVTGYFRPVANWNLGKKEEFKDRQTFAISRAVVDEPVVASSDVLCDICGALIHKGEPCVVTFGKEDAIFSHPRCASGKSDASDSGKA